MPILHLLPAANGDCLLLQWQYQNQNHHLLIDGGTPGSYPTGLKPVLQQLHDANEIIDLLVLTHIDNDHIGGILKLASEIEKGDFRKNFVNQWWYNSRAVLGKAFNDEVSNFPGIALPKDNEAKDTQISFNQGKNLEFFLTKNQNHYHRAIHLGIKPIEIGGAKITILSPNLETLKKLYKNWEKYVAKETKQKIVHATSDYEFSIEDLSTKKYFPDSSVFNASSIAFLFEFDDLALLFLGDAVPEIYIPAIKELCEQRSIPNLKLDLVKISHHGSRFNFNKDLLECINCTQYATSTDGKKHAHPHKTTFAKIIKSKFRTPNEKIHFYFNYSSDSIKKIFQKEYENKEDQKYSFQCHLPKPNEKGYLINFVQ
jgi:Predicted hydrolase (metallo-beta-lactamase superfamily)